MKKTKWYVTGVVENNRGGYMNKTVKVLADSKVDAIDKGLKKLDTKQFVECKMIIS